MTTLSALDRRWLDAAVREATPFLGTAAGQATVGAIITDAQSRKLLGRGVTEPGGSPSAEAIAIEEAGEAGRGSTLYVTLGPGAGAQFIDTVLAAGLARVVVGIEDPSGSGGQVGRLGAAGVEVTVADHAPSCRLHEGYISLKTRSRPFVTASLAVSADGKAGIEGQGGFSVTGDEARRWTKMQRAQADALLIGWGTARLDDPTLAVDLKGLDDRHPLRVVVAGLKAVEPRLALLSGEGPAGTLVVATPEKKLNAGDGVEVLRIKGTRSRPELPPVMLALGERGIQSLFVEAGPTLLETLLAKDLVDRFHLLQSEVGIGPKGLPSTPKGSIESRIALAGFSLVDHRLLGADNLRTFERIF